MVLPSPEILALISHAALITRVRSLLLTMSLLKTAHAVERRLRYASLLPSQDIEGDVSSDSCSVSLVISPRVMPGSPSMALVQMSKFQDTFEYASRPAAPAGAMDACTCSPGPLVMR